MILITLLSVVTSIYAINRPVYKIVLTQKGYAQFLQYDLETPPLREFTFCTWIRIYELGNDQTIFAYVANRSNRIMRLWLDSGGKYLKLSINQKVTTSFPFEIVKDVWRHICISYQSEFGAWALYIDSRLVGCNSAQSLYGYVLPPSGSVIVGYSVANDGTSNGFEGEVFGANMILISTIERNYTSKTNPDYDQKAFQKNKLKAATDPSRYIILDYLESDYVQNNFENLRNTSEFLTTKKSARKYSTEKNRQETSTRSFIENNSFDFWKVLNQSDSNQKSLYVKYEPPVEPTTRRSPLISEFETPPTPVPKSTYFGIDFEQPKSSTYSKIDATTIQPQYFPTDSREISEVEMPPPIEKNNKHVYGQWTSSKFAGAVLNYLKSINFQNKDHQNFIKTPATIPLKKVSDTYPYASDLIFSRIRPPFHRRNVIEKRYDTIKRDPQINVQIIENDLRSNILKMHAQNMPKKVEISSRGEPKKYSIGTHRFYRHIGETEESESIEEDYNAQYNNNQKKNRLLPQGTISYNTITQKSKTALPFLRSLEYTVDDTSANKEYNSSEDIFSKKLTRARNKWHNVKSYNNDYTPHKINSELENNRYPSVRLKFKYENEYIDDPNLLKARKLAMEVSNSSDSNKDKVSILKYNHRYLSKQENKKERERMNAKRNLNHNSFDRQVKIGNILNERNLLGKNEVQQQKSFVGGHEYIPDIDAYIAKDPISLNGKGADNTRVCKDLELYDRVLYVQPDESIDMSHILSPVRDKNVAIDFIMQNYKKCSLKDSKLEVNPKLYIDWIKTPVRLFGGAFPRRTTDLCGFF